MSEAHLQVEVERVETKIVLVTPKIPVQGYLAPKNPHPPLGPP